MSFASSSAQARSGAALVVSVCMLARARALLAFLSTLVVPSLFAEARTHVSLDHARYAAIEAIPSKNATAFPRLPQRS
jgi:hypothetical protein